jgi:hypothetical protein
MSRMPSTALGRRDFSAGGSETGSLGPRRAQSAEMSAQAVLNWQCARTLENAAGQRVGPSRRRPRISRREGCRYSCRDLGGRVCEDRRPWLSRFSTSRSGRCWARSFGVAAVWTSRTSSCSSCVTSSRSCAARWRGRTFVPRIVPCWRRRPATWHAPRAARAWSLRRLCCAGIVRSCAGSGDSRPTGAGAHPSRLRCARSCCGWLTRIRAGPSADQRGARQTRLRSVAIDRPSATRPRWVWAGSTALRSGVAGVPARSGGEHRRLRLLHR